MKPLILPNQPALLKVMDEWGVRYVVANYEPEPKGGSAQTIMDNINRRLRDHG